MRRALIRADGSAQLGLGHIMRCIGLAQGLETTGINSLFVIRNDSPAIKGLIERHGFPVQSMPHDFKFEQDLEVTANLSRQKDVRLVVTDLSTDGFLRSGGECKAYLQELKKDASFLITVDDLNVLDFPSDIVINPNYGAEKLNYDRGSYVKYLLGPAYFIFRREFIEASKIERKISRQAKNILVTLGGSDTVDLTCKVLKALSRLEISGLNLCILPGVVDSSSREQLLTDVLKGFKGTFRFFPMEYNMAELMLWADLAITGGGLTKYETAVTGTPSIIITRIKHQKEVTSLFAREGSTLFLDTGNDMVQEEIAIVVDRVIKDRELRADMSLRGRKLVDGRGIERIIAEIPREILE